MQRAFSSSNEVAAALAECCNARTLDEACAAISNAHSHFSQTNLAAWAEHGVRLDRAMPRWVTSWSKDEQQWQGEGSVLDAADLVLNSCLNVIVAASFQMKKMVICTAPAPLLSDLLASCVGGTPQIFATITATWENSVRLIVHLMLKVLDHSLVEMGCSLAAQLMARNRDWQVLATRKTTPNRKLKTQFYF